MATIEAPRVSIDAQASNTGKLSPEQERKTHEGMAAAGLGLENLVTGEAKQMATKLKEKMAKGEKSKDILSDLREDESKRPMKLSAESITKLNEAMRPEKGTKDFSAEANAKIALIERCGKGEAPYVSNVAEGNLNVVNKERQILENKEKNNIITSEERAKLTNLKAELRVIESTRDVFMKTGIGSTLAEGWSAESESKWRKDHGMEGKDLDDTQKKELQTYAKQQIQEKATQAAAIMLQDEQFRGLGMDRAKSIMNTDLSEERQTIEEKARAAEALERELVAKKLAKERLDARVAKASGGNWENSEEAKRLQEEIGKSSGTRKVQLEAEYKTKQEAKKRGGVNALIEKIGDSTTGLTKQIQDKNQAIKELTNNMNGAGFMKFERKAIYKDGKKIGEKEEETPTYKDNKQQLNTLKNELSSLITEHQSYEHAIQDIEENKSEGLYAQQLQMQKELSDLEQQSIDTGRAVESAKQALMARQNEINHQLDDVFTDTTKAYMLERLSVFQEHEEALLEEQRAGTVDQTEKDLYDRMGTRLATLKNTRRIGFLEAMDKIGKKQAMKDFLNGKKFTHTEIAVNGINARQVKDDLDVLLTEGSDVLIRKMLEGDPNLTARKEASNTYTPVLDSDGKTISSTEKDRLSQQDPTKELYIIDGIIQEKAMIHPDVEAKMKDQEWVARVSENVVRNLVKKGLMTFDPDSVTDGPLLDEKRSAMILERFGEQLAPSALESNPELKQIVEDNLGEDAFSTPDNTKETLDRLAKGNMSLFFLLLGLLGAIGGTSVEMAKRSLEKGVY